MSLLFECKQCYKIWDNGKYIPKYDGLIEMRTD